MKDVDDQPTDFYVDRHFILAPGLQLYVTPNGWYTLEWDFKPGQVPNMLLALRSLRTLMEHGSLPPSNNARKYYKDEYRTAEDLAEDMWDYAIYFDQENIARPAALATDKSSCNERN